MGGATYVSSWKWRMQTIGDFCGSLRSGNPDCGDFSGRSAVVFGSILADRMRLRLLPALERRSL